MSRLPDRLPGRVDPSNANYLVSSPGRAGKGADSLDLSGSPRLTTSTPSRTSRLRLPDLRSNLSDRDLAILRTVDEFRFVSGKQLEALHFRGHATPSTASRMARRVLDRLVELTVLSRLERRVGGVRAGSASYVYGIGPVGQRLVVDDGSRGRWKEPSLNFLNHTLAVAQLAVDLHGSAAEGGGEIVSIEPEPDCWRTFNAGTFSARETLKPDLAVVIGKGEFEDRWLIEIDLGTESSTAIKKKADVYLRYLKTGAEQKTFGVFPRVVWVAPGGRRTAFLQSTLANVKGVPPGLFSVVEASTAVELLMGDEQ